MDDLATIRSEALGAVEQAADLGALETVRVAALGKKGSVTGLMKTLGALAPEQRKVKAGFAREDLFVCVHEQFMTATARMADVVIPATMFLEHDDVYQGGGHQHIMLGPKLVEPPGECRSNHQVICGLAKRVEQASAVDDWAAAVGAQIAAVSTALSVTPDGTLFVAVATHAWMTELSLLEPELLAALNRGEGRQRVRKIRFRLRG